MEQTVLYLGITLLKLFRGEWNLRQIILALVRVVGCRVKTGLLFLRFLLNGCYGVALFLGKLSLLIFLAVEVADIGFVGTLPVVHVIALSPCTSKGLFSLLYGCRIVEIPCSLSSSCSTVVVLRHSVFVLPLTCIIFFLYSSYILLRLFVALLLLFLLQGIDDAVDSRVTVFLTHLGKELERVLKFHGIGIWYEFVENLTAFRELLIVVAVLVKESDSLAIAASGITVFLFCPVQVAEMQKQHALLYAGACSLLVSCLVSVDGLCGIFQGKVYITYGIIYLIKVFLVVLVGCHAFQAGYHLSCLISVGKNLCHGYSGIELHFVWRILTDNLLECLVCLVLMSEGSLYLSEKIVFTCALL